MEDYEDEELRLDNEYRDDMIRETNEQCEKDYKERRYIFIYSDIQYFLDNSGLTNELFFNLSIEKIQELLSILS